jgi:hypothetical protein
MRWFVCCIHDAGGRMIARGAALIAAILLPAALRAQNPSKPLRLFHDAQNVLLRGNRVDCNVDNIGELCVSPLNSPSEGGGFWPRGTQDQYVFNQGLQVAGIISTSVSAPFPWMGDTVGAFFFDARGDQQHGTGLSRVYDALNPRDRGSWPASAQAFEPGIFSPLVIGQSSVSAQDTWVRFWDGRSALANGRKHPA